MTGDGPASAGRICAERRRATSSTSTVSGTAAIPARTGGRPNAAPASAAPPVINSERRVSFIEIETYCPTADGLSRLSDPSISIFRFSAVTTPSSACFWATRRSMAAETIRFPSGESEPIIWS
jgi:hypothetical protein